MGKIAISVYKKFSSDPPIWAIWLLLLRAIAKSKSALLSRIFHARGLDLGKGSRIRGASHISFGQSISAHSNLWLEAITQYRDQKFTPKIIIGDGVSFSDSVHISCIDQITIKKHVLIGSRVYISDHNHGTYKGETQQSNPDEAPAHRLLGGGGPVLIEENVWIGDNVVIVGPVRIGSGSIVGANSVVRKDVPPGTIVTGSPSKVIRQFDATTGRWERI
ncbi:MAG: DapH/DapD/GlmU-related protein [Acidobacteriaceae bacterium]